MNFDIKVHLLVLLVLSLVMIGLQRVVEPPGLLLILPIPGVFHVLAILSGAHCLLNWKNITILMVTAILTNYVGIAAVVWLTEVLAPNTLLGVVFGNFLAALFYLFSIRVVLLYGQISLSALLVLPLLVGMALAMDVVLIGELMDRGAIIYVLVWWWAFSLGFCVIAYLKGQNT